MEKQIILFSITQQSYLNADKILTIACALYGIDPTNINPVSTRTHIAGIALALQSYMEQQPETKITQQFLSNVAYQAYNGGALSEHSIAYSQLCTTILDVLEYLHHNFK